MKEDEIRIITEIIDKINEGAGTEALEKISALPEHLLREIRVCMATGDAHYEIGDYVSAIKYYVRVVRKSRRPLYVNHALLTIATTLQNLGMFEESKRVIELIDRDEVLDSSCLKRLEEDANERIVKQGEVRLELSKIGIT